MASETSGRDIVPGAWRVLAAALLTAGALTAQAAPISGQGTWESTLQGRDINGNPVALLDGSGYPNPDAKYFYDTQLNLTWLGDWNAKGAMTWAAANAWAADLLDFGGGWSLPGVLDIGMDGCAGTAYSGTDCGYNVYGSEAARRGSPLAHMYYDTLGNLAEFDTSGNVQSGWGLTNTGPFSKMQSDYYWSGTEYAPVAANKWNFDVDSGLQHFGYRFYNEWYAVAVRRGDVAAVPEPRSLVLALLGLAVLWVVRRRRPG